MHSHLPPQETRTVYTNVAMENIRGQRKMDIILFPSHYKFVLVGANVGDRILVLLLAASRSPPASSFCSSCNGEKCGSQRVYLYACFFPLIILF